jgi:hypothetical protein
MSKAQLHDPMPSNRYRNGGFSSYRGPGSENFSPVTRGGLGLKLDIETNARLQWLAQARRPQKAARELSSAWVRLLALKGCGTIHPMSDPERKLELNWFAGVPLPPQFR